MQHNETGYVSNDKYMVSQGFDLGLVVIISMIIVWSFVTLWGGKKVIKNRDGSKRSMGSILIDLD